MKLRYLVGLVATGSLLAGGACLAACSDDEKLGAVSPKDAGRDSTAGNDSGTGSNDAATDTGTTTDASDAGPLPVSCTNYCNVIMSNCKDGNMQYGNMATCLAVCPLFELGDAAAGNTIACRQYHATAAVAGNEALHCPHGGPSGSTQCGTRCEALCTLATNGACAFDSGVLNPPYVDYAQCMSLCEGDAGQYTFNPDAGEKFGSSITGDNIQCRIYHLLTAHVTPPSSANAHCYHGSLDSGMVCKNP